MDCFPSFSGSLAKIFTHGMDAHCRARACRMLNRRQIARLVDLRLSCLVGFGLGGQSSVRACVLGSGDSILVGSVGSMFLGPE